MKDKLAPTNDNVENSSEPRVECDQDPFAKAYADYLNADKAPDDLDGTKLYSVVQRLIHTRAVTTEQIGRKVEILLHLLGDTSQSRPERQLLASIKEDLDAIG
jgi:hypothetical protein